MGPHTVTLVSAVALVVWLGVLATQWEALKDDAPMDAPVREATVVALLACLIGGTVASLGFSQFISESASATLAGLWRGAVLACGMYALVVVARLRRRGR
jgi:hypothetical protein